LKDDNFLREDVGIGKVVAFLDAIVSELEVVEAGFVAADTADSDSKC
jgi:hypothetical protein